MNRRGAYILLAASGGLLLCWGGYKLYAKNRDKRAARFLSLLQAEIQPGKSNLSGNDFFDVNYAARVMALYPLRVIGLQPHAARTIAKGLESSFGTFDSEPNATYAELRAIKDKVAGSQVSAAYKDEFGRSLLLDLQDELGEENMPHIISVAFILPL